MFSTSIGAARLSLAIIIGLILVKVLVAIVTGSISITAQALDSLLDLFAVAVTAFAIRVSSMPADEEHPFGHGKVEGFAAVVQAVLIFAAAGLIIYSAVRRIIEGSRIEIAEAGIAVMLVSVIASFFLSRHLLRVSRATGSVAVEASARNIAADVYSAAGVLLGLVVIRFTGLNIIDSIIALGVSLLILKAGYDVIRRSFGELVDVKLPEVEEEMIIACLKEHSNQMVGFHAVRTRKSGSQRFIDLHLVMPRDVSVDEAHQTCDHLEEEIETLLQHSSVTIHVEPCTIECVRCEDFTCSLRREFPSG